MSNKPPDLPAASLPGTVQVAEDGHAEIRLDNYSLAYYPRLANILVVTFDPRMKTYPPAESRIPWARDFLESHGVSALQVKPDASCWYRLPDLEHAFTVLSEAGFFDGFGTVVTYGGSMGGFGALSFAGQTKAKRVLAINPQINLGPAVRSWEHRYAFATGYDWDGALCDIGAQLCSVEMPIVCYDPYHEVDRRQVELIDAQHCIHLRVPFVGHRMPGHLQAMRILKPLFRRFLHGALDPLEFQQLARRRRSLLRYKEMMLHKAARYPTRRARLERLLPPDEELLGKPSRRVLDDED